ncbi:MAG TPA: hypothetical protein VMI54_04345 [Polyangiaceae bacterium]|nr:hypothetical protein [Polyangiaceae bacterium]
MCAALAMGAAPVGGCSSNHEASVAENVGTITLPLSTTVGTDRYRLDAVFTIHGDQGVITLATNGDESALSAPLPAGAYEVELESFTLFKDDGIGNFEPVTATVVASSLPFTISADSITTVAFHFLTDGVTIVPGTGNVDLTFDVTDTSCRPITVDPAARTVRSARFFLDFSNAVANDPEDLDVIEWAGSANLAQSFASDACTSNVVEYFGNAWAPPDPNSGGLVLAGSGSSGTWTEDGDSIAIHSTSSGCSASTDVPVETRYRFREGIGADTIEVERTFDFSSASVSRPFRPFMPRLTDSFDRVLHPNAAGTSLLSEDISACPFGCQVGDWDGSWFAYVASSGPLAGQGMIVRREPSAVPVNLWVDSDGGVTYTNTSSALLLEPAGGFPPAVSEKELLCFFDAGSWTPDEQGALTLPAGCALGLACNSASPCQPSPCEHGGTCSLDGAGGYACECPATVTGRNCETVFTDLAVGQGFSCGLRSDEQIACWGAGYGAQQVPSGQFRALSAGGLSACALRTDGTIACWGQSDTGALNAPAGSFETIAAMSDYGCATHDEVPTCWGGLEAFGPAPNDRFSAIDIGAWHSCGIRPDGSVGCWGLLNAPWLDFGQANPPPGAFRALSLTTYESCGIRQADGVLECWGDDVFGGAPLPNGAVLAVDINSHSGCVIDEASRISCFGTDYPTPPAGFFKRLAISETHGCALGLDDRVVCWGGGDGETTPPY